MSYYIPNTLLTVNNPKIEKGTSSGWLTAGLFMAPGTVNGVNYCPGATKGCLKACLNTAGRGAMQKIQTARINKNLYFQDNQELFIIQLKSDIFRQQKRADKLGLKLAIRLNGTTDINWNKIAPELFTMFPDVQFYDYSKCPGHFNNLPDNYHLTFSFSGSNWKQCLKLLKQGYNVAMVFINKPVTVDGFNTIDGDKTDLRFLDGNGVIAGLKAKGKALFDTSGFVVENKKLATSINMN